ncbi:hypothetical protein EDD18DRAFT_1112211 [Armillaria luteobubalina]|uniref:Uncharacterized protein n=1 Tax=Armillaria luteobubalina TaxID=153913 RepID=A0AA39TE55_9AGAR|nr:hypothetical protein EDD18DRAFT_1112211 [Armillaria luteobubalina]
MANAPPTTPSTPSRLPPISCPPLSTPGRPPSPLNASEVANFSMQAVPVRCKLIIRGITLEDGKTANEIICETLELKVQTRNDLTVVLDDNNELYNIMQTEPRPDLLNPWIPVLSSLNLNWQASWSPCKMGKDKKLWCRISGMSGNSSKSNWDKDLAVITDAIRKLGVNISSSWSTVNGQMGVVVLSHIADVSFLMSKSPLSITLPNQDPSVSGHHHPSRIDITAPYKQIDPTYVFKVVITRIGDYDHSSTLHLNRYFTTLTEPDSTSFLRSSHIPETDVYCVVLSSWEVMKTVLSNMEFFDQHVHSSTPNVTYPCLLWEVNMMGAFAQRAFAAINKAGDMLEARLDLFELKINKIHKETSANLNTITGAVTQMWLALQDTQMALMAQHRRSQITDHHLSLYHCHETLIRKLDRAQNSQEEDTVNAELDIVSQKIEEMDKQLNEFDRTITGIVAGPPQHPQQIVNPTPLTPTHPNRQPIPSTPESPLAAKRQLHHEAGPCK